MGATWVRFGTLGCLQLMMILRPGMQNMRICHKIPKLHPLHPHPGPFLDPMALYGAAFSAEPTVCDFDPSNRTGATWVRFGTLGCLQLVMIPRPGMQNMRICHKIPKPTPFTPLIMGFFLAPWPYMGPHFRRNPV